MSTGLRERKKLKTRNAIQKEAMRLFLAKGYEETTIEDIAESVEISPSTFFNYFPSKEAVVFQDDLDPLILSAFNRQPAHVKPIAALRNAMREVFAGLPPDALLILRERGEVAMSSPELRSAVLSQFADLVGQIAEPLAKRLGRRPADFEVRNVAGAVLGVMIAAYFAAADNPKTDYLELVDRSLAHLEAGLPL